MENLRRSSRRLQNLSPEMGDMTCYVCQNLVEAIPRNVLRCCGNLAHRRCHIQWVRADARRRCGLCRRSSNLHLTADHLNPSSAPGVETWPRDTILEELYRLLSPEILYEQLELVSILLCFRFFFFFVVVVASYSPKDHEQKICCCMIKK